MPKFTPKIHRHAGYKPPVERKRDADQRRGSAASRGYGHRWRKARAAWLRENPLCVECKRQGRVTEAREVDHIRPHRGDEALFWDRANWQSLCKACHSRKTIRDAGLVPPADPAP